MRLMFPSIRAGARAAMVSLCVVSMLSASLPAAAQTKKKATTKKVAPKSLADTLTGDAKAEYEAGKLLYQDGDYKNALAKFQKAQELSSDARLSWNIAACEKNLRRYTRVLAAVERYQREGGALLTDQDRLDAEDLARTVRTLVSTIKLTVDEPGADVFVDDEKVATSPLTAPLLVDAGARKIRVVKPGYKEVVKTEQVAGATEMALVVKLERDLHEGRLVVEAGPKDSIFIDGKPVAVGRWEGVLPSGGHLLQVTAPSKVPYQSEVIVQDGSSRRIPITLEGKFPTAIVLGTTGGVLAAAGAVIAIVVLTRPATPDPTKGTLAPGVVPVGFGGFRFGGVR